MVECEDHVRGGTGGKPMRMCQLKVITLDRFIRKMKQYTPDRSVEEYIPNNSRSPLMKLWGLSPN